MEYREFKIEFKKILLKSKIYIILKYEKKICILLKYLLLFFSTILNLYLLFIFRASKNNILNYENIDSIIKEKFKKEIDFAQSCFNESKIELYEKYDKPKISLVIPFYNAEKYLTRLLRSIQNQELKEIEIIFVEDCSTDNGLRLLEKYGKKDKRIKIIRNKKNKGCLYSYSRGILEAKANHTMFLDDDDILLSNLKQLYEISYNNNIDINDFGFVQGDLNHFDQVVRSDQILYQPNIGEIMFAGKYIGPTIIVDKIYKTEILKNAIKAMKKEYFDAHIIIHCDTILFIHFFYFAKTYQSFSNLFGFFHIFNGDTASSDMSNKYNRVFRDTLYLVDYVSEMNYSSNDIYNGHIKFSIDILNWPLELCGERRLDVDWKHLNKTMNKILNNKILNENNTFGIHSLIKKIKLKNNNPFIK